MYLNRTHNDYVKMHQSRIHRLVKKRLCYDCGNPSKGFFRCGKCRSRLNKNKGLSGKIEESA